ncbi:MAG: histidine phosphatase family protein [Chitinophaga sp.]|nr:histidine phosphatase family protein [Chitinophaga sp.]
MTQIAIIRHGTTSWNKAGKLQGHSDIPLDDEGKLQALKLGQRLSSESWDLVYSSHLIRARQTAAIVAQELGLDSVIEDHRLGEAGGGLIEGTTEEERQAKWGASWKLLDLGMESNAAVVARGRAFLTDLLAENPGKKILLVTHGSFIRQMLDALLPAMHPTPPMKNTSITRLQFSDENWHCELFNCVIHLDNSEDTQ